jgi:hypothetical protein
VYVCVCDQETPKRRPKVLPGLYTPLNEMNYSSYTIMFQIKLADRNTICKLHHVTAVSQIRAIFKEIGNFDLRSK